MRLLVAGVLFSITVWGAWATGFDEGKSAFGNKDWTVAANLLGRFVQENPEDPQAPSAAFLRGVALYQLGDFRGSLDAFQKLERNWPLTPYTGKLPYWKGTAALAAGQWALAERELSAQARYPDQEPFTTRALLNLALARQSLGKDDLAVQSLSAFTKASHENSLVAQAWAVWGDLDRNGGRLDQALVRYQAASAAEPGGTWDLAARTQEIDLLMASKRWIEARVLLDSSTSLFPSEKDRWDTRKVLTFRALGMVSDLKTTLELLWGRESNPQKKQGYAANRARVSEESGKPEAEWWLRASLGPDSELGSRSIVRYAFLTEAESRWGIAADALDGWAAAQRVLSSGESARSRAAEDRRQAGDFAGAVGSWTRLIADFPMSSNLPGWLLARGSQFLADGHDSEALGDFNRLIKNYPKAPEAPEARYQTGLVYLKRQEPARAEGWFYGLVEDLKTGDLYQRALLARGVCFVNSGQTDLARGSLQRLLRESPDGPWAGGAWSALGRNAAQARLFDEAVDAYRHAELAFTDPQDKASAQWALAEAQSSSGSFAASSGAFADFYHNFPTNPRAGEAQYRQGAVYMVAKDWQAALKIWTPLVPDLSGLALAETREGMATAFLHLGHPEDGWSQLEALEAKSPSPDVWYRWGQTALSLGQSDWAMKAFQYLLQKHPQSPAAEAALPRAAGALLTGGKADEAVARYADYFMKFGKEPAAAPVARAAAAAAQNFPKTLELLVSTSRTWDLSPEVTAEFTMAWAQSRLDSDTDNAKKELQDLSQTATWTSQRSEALAVLGRWNLGRGNLPEARADLEAAAGMGDDLSEFKARWALAQVTEKEGDLVNAARQRESAERAAGPGVPVEFRIQILQEAMATWSKATRPDDAARVSARIQSLSM